MSPGANPAKILITLRKKLKGKSLLLGLGNILRGDDCFGAILAKRIRRKTCLKVLEAEDAPENFLDKIIKENPDTILFVDAVDFGGKAGEMRLWNLENVKPGNFFLTHNPSPRMLCDFLRGNSEAKMYLLGIQPKDIRLGAGISPQIRERLDALKVWFLQNYPKNTVTD